MMTNVLSIRIAKQILVFQNYTLSDNITTTLTEIEIPTFTSEKNLKIDLGTEETFDFKFWRVHPHDWVPADDLSTDSTIWSNRKWYEVFLSDYVDRWQMRTDGATLSYQSDVGFHLSFEVNGYITYADITANINGNGDISGNVKFSVGSAYVKHAPPRPENMRVITYICDGDGDMKTRSIITYARLGESINLITPSQEWLNSKTNYVASGWTTTSGGTQMWTFGQSRIVGSAPFGGSDEIYYLAWIQRIPVTVRIYAGGSCGGVSNLYSMYIGDTFTFPALPSGWTGCGTNFIGYGPSGSSLLYPVGSSIVLDSSMVTGGFITFYARWEYLITIYGGGTCTGQSVQFSSPSSFTVPNVPPALSTCGDVFVGYAWTNGGMVMHQPGDVITISSALNLWCIWKTEITQPLFSTQTAQSGTLNIGPMADVSGITVYLQGGGGGGGGGGSGMWAGGGGGGGQRRFFRTNVVQQTYQWTVGAGGNGGWSGGNGGDSTFGLPTDPFYAVAPGGIGGGYGTGNGGGGGTGGTSMGGGTSINGGNGGNGGNNRDPGTNGQSVGAGTGGSGGQGAGGLPWEHTAGGGGGGSGSSLVSIPYGYNIQSRGGNGGSRGTPSQQGSNGGGGGGGIDDWSSSQQGSNGGAGYMVVLIHRLV